MLWLVLFLVVAGICSLWPHHTVYLMMNRILVQWAIRKFKLHRKVDLEAARVGVRMFLLSKTAHRNYTRGFTPIADPQWKIDRNRASYANSKQAVDIDHMLEQIQTRLV